jgi:hypothetical protein
VIDLAEVIQRATDIEDVSLVTMGAMGKGFVKGGFIGKS